MIWQNPYERFEDCTRCGHRQMRVIKDGKCWCGRCGRRLKEVQTGPAVERTETDRVLCWVATKEGKRYTTLVAPDAVEGLERVWTY